MTADAEIVASFLDDCWEPDEAIEVLRREGNVPDARLAILRAACFLVPEGRIEGARIVDATAPIDDTLPPSRTRYLWVLASAVPSRAALRRLYLDFMAAE